MDYVNIPTTVFTPLEYGCVGYSEKDACDQFGTENVLCFHMAFKPVEWKFHGETNAEND